VIISGIAQRYAKALLLAASKQDAVKEVYEDTQGFLSLLVEQPAFRDFLLSPQVSTEKKQEVIKKVIGPRASHLVVKLIDLLVEKKRFMFVEEIVEAYKNLYEKHMGIVEIRAVTAIPLDESLEAKLHKKLEEETKKTIRLETMVDPSIIGGVILQMEDKVIDGSIRHKLEMLKRHLFETRVDALSGGTPPAEKNQ
jgi:F-type H+-transporting ATPase subunit delta